MKMLYVGGKCSNDCFSGKCAVHMPKEAKELSYQEMSFELGKLYAQGHEVFVYTPDMFSDEYFESIFMNMPAYQGFRPYIGINAGVRTLIDRLGLSTYDGIRTLLVDELTLDMLVERGIKEVCLGVESGSRTLRDIYGKPAFTNQEVIHLTRVLMDMGINVCWYLVDSRDDDDATRLKTYNLILEGHPYRIRLERLTDET